MDDKPLEAALATLQAVTNADDLRYLDRFIARELNPYADVRGVKGGFAHYPLSKTLQAVINAVQALDEEDQQALAMVVALLYEAYRPKTDAARGQVQIKSIRRNYPEIDFQASQEKKTLVFVTDENGQPVFATFYFHYAYIRIYAAKGGADRKSPKLLSIYADRGMGKGGSGGYVAAALADNLVTEDEALDAWHAGEAVYAEFMDRCEELVGKPSDQTGETVQADQPPAEQTDQAAQQEPAPTIPGPADATENKQVKKPRKRARGGSAETPMPPAMLPPKEADLLAAFAYNHQEGGRGVLKWNVYSQSHKKDKPSLLSLVRQGFLEIIQKERSEVIYKLTDAGLAESAKCFRDNV